MQVNEEKLQVLMNIVFPEEGFLDVPELFYHSEACLQGLDGLQQEGKRYSFDTWMNLFAVKKWRTYCDFDRVFLRLRAKGRMRLELVGHKLDAGFGAVKEMLEAFEWDFSAEYSQEAFPVSIPEGFDAVSFHVVPGKGGAVSRGAWCTDSQPLRQNRIAIVSCTFRREEYIRATMKKFQGFMAADPAMQERFHLFVVDNGKTLEETRGEHITVLHNMNAGGAGGFARGLMEANDGGYSRCLFLDDDVQILPESFFRTLTVSDYLREEYQDAFIGGAMMNMHKKNLCTESLTVRNGFWIRGYHEKCTVAAPREILRCIHVDPKVFDQEKASSSWWFACFSLTDMGGEYPIPAFIRGDDAEWSWRRFGTHHITLNGICVWHLPWEWKTSRLVDQYYLPRNMFLAHAVHDKKFQETFEEDFTQVFEHLLNTLDYASVDLYLAAMTDILKGREAFAENPLRQRARLARLCPKPETHASHDKGKLLELGRRSLRGIQGRKGLALDFNTDPGCYQGKQEVKVYNLLQESYELRVRDEGKEQRARREFAGLLYLMGRKYEALAEHMKKCQEEFKTRAFWDDYLGLERQSI
mgnify:CR=1 FL=1